MKALFAFGALLVCPIAATAQDESPTFRTGVRVVNVPCTVRGPEGHYVSNLTKDDFTIREGGVEQKATYFSAPGDDPLSVTLLLDTNPPWLDFLLAEKNAAIHFFEAPLEKSQSASLARFDHDFWVVEDFTDSAKRLLAAAHKLPEHGAEADPKLNKRLPSRGVSGTNLVQTGRNAQLYEAMFRAATALQNRQGRKALIVVSNWLDLGTRLGLDNVLQAAGQSSTVLYPIRISEVTDVYRAGPGELLTNAIMRKLAEDTGGRNLDVNADHELPALLEQIRQELSAQYLLGYTPTGVADGNAYRRIEVATRATGLRVRARAGYESGKPQPAAEDAPTFSTTGTAPAPPAAPPRSFETPMIHAPELPACALFPPPNMHPGRQLGGLEQLTPPAQNDAPGPEDAEAAAIVKMVAETYRKAQSIYITGVWERVLKTRGTVHEFDRADMQHFSERSKATVSISMERSGAVRLDVDATWDLMPLARSAEPFASQYRFVTDGGTDWMYWPASGVYSRSPAGARGPSTLRLVLDRYADPANYPVDLSVVRHATAPQSSGNPLHYVVLRGGGPAAGLTHEFWVDEEHHVVLFEQFRDWGGRVAANLMWKQQSLNATLAKESMVFTPPPNAIQTANPLGSPEPRCQATLPFYTPPSEVTPADFTLPDQNGEAVRFAELKGIVTLTFWHTWTPLAIPQIQALEKLQKSHGAARLTVLGYTDEPPEVVKAFLEKTGLTLRTIIDTAHSAKWLYPSTPGFREMRYTPTTVVVRRNKDFATAWPGGLSGEGLEQALQLTGR
jgi:Ca-activated chloride channel family protein